MRPTFDERDEQIRKLRLELLDRQTGPRCGDWIDFADGVRRRISHVWDWEDGTTPTYQTSHEGGGYYLGEGFVAFSGSLYQSVPGDTLTLTNEKREGRVWFFHHGYQQAHNGVDSVCTFRVYRCSLDAPGA